MSLVKFEFELTVMSIFVVAQSNTWPQLFSFKMKNTLDFQLNEKLTSCTMKEISDLSLDKQHMLKIIINYFFIFCYTALPYFSQTSNF